MGVERVKTRGGRRTRVVTMSDGYRIAIYNPFWRFAVVADARRDLTGIPYYGEAAARRTLAEMLEEIPEVRPRLVRRHLFRGVEVID